jgi:hypothetical protein
VVVHRDVNERPVMDRNLSLTLWIAFAGRAIDRAFISRRPVCDLAA